MGDRLAELQKIAAVTPNTNEEKGEETSQDEPFVLFTKKIAELQKDLNIFQTIYNSDIPHRTLLIESQKVMKSIRTKLAQIRQENEQISFLEGKQKKGTVDERKIREKNYK